MAARNRGGPTGLGCPVPGEQRGCIRIPKDGHRSRFRNGNDADRATSFVLATAWRSSCPALILRRGPRLSRRGPDAVTLHPLAAGRLHRIWSARRTVPRLGGLGPGDDRSGQRPGHPRRKSAGRWSCSPPARTTGRWPCRSTAARPTTWPRPRKWVEDYGGDGHRHQHGLPGPQGGQGRRRVGHDVRHHRRHGRSGRDGRRGGAGPGHGQDAARLGRRTT